MKKLAKLATKYPKTIIATILLLTFVFTYFATRVTITTDIKDFFPGDDPRVITYNEMEKVFGGAEYIMVAIKGNDIFQYNTLRKIEQITKELESLNGVASVRSLTSIDQIQGSDWGLEITPLVQELPETEEESQELKKKVLNDDLYGGIIVSKDGKAALNIIEVEPEADSIKLAAEVAERIKTYGGPEEIYLTGTPVLNNVLADSMKDDLKRLLPVVLAIIALILYFYFRDVKGVLLPFVTVLISVSWTQGFMAVLDKPLSPLNIVMPIILVSLGNAYGIYLLNRFREEVALGKGKIPAINSSIITVGLAIVMAGGTTVAGFASNVFSDITLMKDFGLFTSFGVAVALIISLTLIPAVLTLLKPDKRDRNIRKTKGSILKTTVNILAQIAINRASVVIGISLLLVMISILGLPRLRIDSNFFNFFAENSQPKIAYNLVKDKFTGSESIEVVIEGSIGNPEVLKAMKGFQEDLKETGIIGEPTSIVNIIERTNKAMHEGREEYKKIPDNPELISQYLLLIEMSDDSYLRNFITMDYKKARIQALVKDTSSEGTDQLLEAIANYTDKHFTNLDVKVKDTGIIVLIDSLANMIVEGQIKGLFFALLTVFIIVLILLRSWQGSLLSVLLIGMVILINFGLMGWMGIPLDIVTVLISSIGVGVGIDYSIHVLNRYQEEKRKGRGLKESLIESIRTTGTSIISNAVAVISGFIILILSSFPPFKYFGVLVSLIMLVAAIGAMLFIPAMMIKINKIKGGVKD